MPRGGIAQAQGTEESTLRLVVADLPLESPTQNDNAMALSSVDGGQAALLDRLCDLQAESNGILYCFYADQAAWNNLILTALNNQPQGGIAQQEKSNWLGTAADAATLIIAGDSLLRAFNQDKGFAHLLKEYVPKIAKGLGKTIVQSIPGMAAAAGIIALSGLTFAGTLYLIKDMDINEEGWVAQAAAIDNAIPIDMETNLFAKRPIGKRDETPEQAMTRKWHEADPQGNLSTLSDTLGVREFSISMVNDKALITKINTRHPTPRRDEAEPQSESVISLLNHQLGRPSLAPFAQAPAPAIPNAPGEWPQSAWPAYAQALPEGCCCSQSCSDTVVEALTEALAQLEVKASPPQVTVTGNVFEVKKESDIDRIAAELARRLSEAQMVS